MSKKRHAQIKEVKRLCKKAVTVFKEQGMGILFERTKFEISRRLFIIKTEGEKTRKTSIIPVRELMRNKFINTRPIDNIRVKRGSFRLNIVTDSLQKDSLFGGVATSLVLATLFVNKYDMPLRIITRTTGANSKAYITFLELMKIKKPKEVEFFSDYDSMYTKSNFKLEVSEMDIFLATSWWTAEAVRSVNLREKFFYILQEVETFFYPNGDEQYRCESILKSHDIHFILNSKLLSDYYKNNNFEQVNNNSVYFEPAFPITIYSPYRVVSKQKSKYKLFFYSRPNNTRNLYFTGLRILDEALLRGIIQSDEWEICFAGASVDNIEFSTGVKPVMCGHMKWEEYVDFLKTVDLAFCLMFTPHPSYPPLDVASSGGIVLTNKFANKKTLDNYSKNIICEDLDIESMMRGFKRAVILAKNHEIRTKNYTENTIDKDWNATFEHVFDFMNNKK
ncbi:MAG: rhamnosyltransferase WsaF family glycosyltransferase [Minisyncoccota bacterium]